MTRPNIVAVDVPGEASARPLASWYTEGSSDGAGDRLLMFDNSGNPSLELLRFRRELAAAPGFEDALRDRVDRLNRFEHPAFPKIRAVEHLDGGGGLTLVSTYTPGKRLGEIFRSPRGRAGVHPAFAAWLIRDLTAALADLQRQGHGITHGALTPDRIVLTSDGRLMIAEHVLGGAIDRLQLSPGRLWHDLGLMAPAGADGTARLDDRTDVIQLGCVVLSVLLGRRVTPLEYPSHIDALFDEFASTSGRRSPAMVPALRCWLERALGVDGPVFESAMEAQDGLRELGIHGGPHAIENTSPDPAPHSLPPASVVARQDALPVPDDRATLVPSYRSEMLPMATAEVAGEVRPNCQDIPARGELVEPRANGSSFDRLRTSGTSGDPSSIQHAAVIASRRVASAWMIVALFAFCALVEAIVIARLATKVPVASPAVVPITLESGDPGDPVMIDGKQIGVTPLDVQVTTGMRSVRVKSRAVPAVVDANLSRPASSAVRPVDLAAPAAIPPARERRGGFRLFTPVELQVFEGEHVLGSSADSAIVTSPGRHQLDFVNAAIGYRSRQVVDIRAGQIGRMSITPPGGRVSVNAIPWAQVWIDGNPIGDTPIANLPLAAGEHQITFRHPQFGEQTQKVVARSAALTRVSATFAR